MLAYFTTNYIRLFCVLLLLTLTVCAIFLCMATYRFLAETRAQIASTAANLRQTSSELKKLANEGRRVVAYEKEEFEEGGYRQRVASAMDNANEIMTQFRTTTIPTLNKAIGKFDKTGDELAKMVDETNRSVNFRLMPEVVRTAQNAGDTVIRTGDDLHQTMENVTTVLNSVNRTTQDIDTLVNDPNITKAIQEIALASEQIRQSSANVQESTREVQEGLKEFPGMAQDLHKFTTAQSKATKLIIAARILPSIAELLRAILP